MKIIDNLYCYLNDIQVFSKISIFYSPHIIALADPSLVAIYLRLISLWMR